MIVSFSHKGLETFFKKGITKGIQANHSVKIGDILDRLNASNLAEDMNYPGSRFHGLKGKRKKYFSVSVSGNWRIIFKFDNGNAEVVDYLDYH